MNRLASLALLALMISIPPAPAQMVEQTRTILTARTTNGSSDAVPVRAGSYQFFAWGTWDGAAVQGEFSINCTDNWAEIATWLATENGGGGPQDIMTGCVRATVTGVGTSSLNFTIQRTQ